MLSVVISSCNSDWTEEQYEQYVSFKAPISGSPAVTRLRLKYRPDTLVNYKLPLIVSGTTTNQKDIQAYVDLDPDTLNDFNVQNFNTRTDLYFKQLEAKHYKLLSNKVTISAGQNQGFLDIDFDFNGLDLVDKWILPLTVQDDPSYNYKAHPLKNFNNALLWITPFNDYSGTYSATNLTIKTPDNNTPIGITEREAHVVDDNTIFFYAAPIKENRADRRYFKIYAQFIPIDEEQGFVNLWSDNAELVNFAKNGQAKYKVTSLQDSDRPYLIHKTVTIELAYSFSDPFQAEGVDVHYNVEGTMSMTRRINTLIEDEEYAIEW